MFLDPLRNLGEGLSRVTERWVPDSWVVGMLVIGVVSGPANGSRQADGLPSRSEGMRGALAVRPRGETS